MLGFWRHLLARPLVPRVQGDFQSALGRALRLKNWKSGLGHSYLEERRTPTGSLVASRE